MKHPPAAELLASVARFLRDELLPAASGARAFNLRVGINAIELVRREIELAVVRDLLTLMLKGGDLGAVLGPVSPAVRKMKREKTKLRSLFHRLDRLV